MKKTLLATLVCSLLFMYNSYAQTVFGIRAGINLSKENSQAMGMNIESETKSGLTFGGFAEISLSKNFAIQPEINFSQMGGKIENASSTLNYVTFPALAKLKFGALSLFAGPQLGFLISTDAKLSNITIETSRDNYVPDEFSAIGGIEFILDNNLLINARYQTGLTNVIKDNILVDSQKNNTLSLTLGYRF